ncbi:hypothetical protein [Salirhabdus salicampi]|uniref:hypothetical protein n=1 Tax=Salirhabdus salicampi TaxID=476102 RepID=UPI003462F82F
MQILNAVKITGATVIMIGMILLLFGLTGSGYSLLVPIGIGTVTGAVFIFIMGVFLVASEEVVKRNQEAKSKLS